MSTTPTISDNFHVSINHPVTPMLPDGLAVTAALGVRLDRWAGRPGYDFTFNMLSMVLDAGGHWDHAGRGMRKN